MFGDEVQSFFGRHIIPKINKHDLTVTSPMRQTLNRAGNIESQERYAKKIISWDLVYFVLRTCFDRMESEYYNAPDKQPGDGEARYEVRRKVVGVRDLREGRGVEVECEVLIQDDEVGGEKHRG